ncbi:Sec-independent protein translocase subunit TatA [Gordonia sp. PP30]|nr:MULTISPECIES: Sec-independent protein translocase subunit TatA [unclassified Gordonia (in: high G+C Gram-positive bacteria)]UQE77016.1 Sec-independent protein translocase subunit TatA [Gordonia sp. PP30]
MQPWHWIVIIIALILIFGSKKLPDAARGLGRSMRILKSEMSEMQKDDKPSETAPAPKPEAPRELPSSEQHPAETAADPVSRSAQERADS